MTNEILPNTAEKKSTLKQFRTIPGVGESIAEDLWELGYRGVLELRGQNPEVMYNKFCDIKGRPIDRCLLYVFRCAVYFSEEENPDPELLKWWNWTDARVALRH